MTFKIETDLDIVDLLKMTSYINSNILIYPHRFKYLLNDEEEKEDIGYYVDIEEIGQLITFAELFGRYLISIRPPDMHQLMAVECSKVEEDYMYAPILRIG